MVVTNPRFPRLFTACRRKGALWLLPAALLTVCPPLPAAVLPDDRADVMYHRFDGGGVEVDGPSILVRKSIGDSLSVSANYYVDSISSASVDVLSTASPYTEERTQTSLSADYLFDNTLMSLSLIRSEESDYQAKTGSFSISHDLFGDLTTVTLGYSVGNDDIGNNLDPAFEAGIKRQSYRIALTQILTKESILSLNWETIADEGYLNNTYRSFRYRDDASPKGYSYALEQDHYPRTRTSNALALKMKYFLPYRAALSSEYRYFQDTWGIRAQNLEIGYTHPLGESWVVDAHYRYYRQIAADFYSDLFERVDAQNYMARDKELSTYRDHTLGLGVSYLFKAASWGFIERGSLNFAVDHMRFDYDDFRDLTVEGAVVGEEPLYGFSANVIKAYLSLWY